MTTDQAGTIIQILATLVIVLVSGGIILTGGLLATVIMLVRSVRSNKAEEQLIERLYQSIPATAQATIKQVGDALGEVSGLIGDISQPAAASTGAATSVTVTVPPAGSAVG